MMMFDAFQQPILIVYGLYKNLLSLDPCKIKSNVLSTMVKVFLVSLSIFTLAIILMLLLPFALFTIGLRVILKLRHGKLYGGLLAGSDNMFELDEDKVIINVVVIAASIDEEDFKIAAEKFVNDIHHTTPKFTCSVEKILGYRYFLRDQVKVDDVIHFVKVADDEYITRDILYNYLKKNCDVMKENQMWKMTVLCQPIQWSENTTAKQYAMILTFRHSLADGPALLSVLRKYMNISDEKKEIKVNMSNTTLTRTLDTAYIQRNPLTTKLDGEGLLIKDCEKWHVVTYTDSNAKYLPMIKRVKQKLNVGFVGVIATAFCSSVMDYIKERNAKMDKLTIQYVVRVLKHELRDIGRGIYNLKNLGNTFSIIAMDAPFTADESSVKKRILHLHDADNSLQHSMDPLMWYVIFRYFCAVAPIPVLRFLAEKFFSNATIFITNLIGFSRSKYRHMDIDDIFFFVPKFMNVGFAFYVSSYDDRLVLTTVSRKGYVNSREKLYDIVENALRYIEEADKEIGS